MSNLLLDCPFGVKQCCSITVILFILHLIDFKLSIQEIGIDLETLKLFVLLFADNYVVFAETVSNCNV